jgi:hypothetical protein
VVTQLAYTGNLYHHHLKHPDRYLGNDDNETLERLGKVSGTVLGIMANGRKDASEADAIEADKKYNGALSSRIDLISGGIGMAAGVGTSYIASPVTGAVVSGGVTTASNMLLKAVAEKLKQDTAKGGIHAVGQDIESSQDDSIEALRKAAEDAGRIHGSPSREKFSGDVPDSITDGYGLANDLIAAHAKDLVPKTGGG